MASRPNIVGTNTHRRIAAKGESPVIHDGEGVNGKFESALADDTNERPYPRHHPRCYIPVIRKPANQWGTRPKS